MATLRRGLLAIGLLAIVFVSTAIVHETGHVLAGLLFGRHLEEVGVMPGIRLYPGISRVPWDGWVAYVNQSQVRPVSAAADGFCNLMGSGTTFIVSYLAMAIIWSGRPRGLWLFFLTAIVMVFGGDIIGYGLFPRLGLRHAILIGGDTAEPRLGAMAMGVPGALFDAALALHATIMLAALCAAAKIRRPIRQREALNSNP